MPDLWRYVQESKKDAYHHGIPKMLYRFTIRDMDSFYNAAIAENSRFIFEVQDWCKDQFGDDRERWGVQGITFNFRDEVDATAFRVRWG